MDAIFKGLQLIKGEKARLVQGVKGNRVPKGALKGKRGSFIVKGTQTQVILILKLENGQNFIADIYRKVLNEYGKKKMTDKFFEFLKVDMPTKKFIVNLETEEVCWS